MRLFISLILLFFLTPVTAQLPDTVRVLPDSVAIRLSDSLRRSRSFSVNDYFTKDYPKPRRAAFLSLLIPGAGQAYNKRWWKLPIVYGVLGGVIWLEVDNVRQYRDLKYNYRLLVDGDPNTNPTEAPYNQIDAVRMKSYRDQWRKYVEQTSLVLGVAYLLQVTDAFVDAHLRDFDVSDDLSLKLKPKIDAVPGMGPTFGAGISLQFGRNDSNKIAQKLFTSSNP